MTTQKKKEEKKQSNTKESYKSGLKKKRVGGDIAGRQLFISLTHPMLASFYVGSFSYTSRAGFFIRPWASHIKEKLLNWNIPCIFSVEVRCQQNVSTHLRGALIMHIKRAHFQALLIFRS